MIIKLSETQRRILALTMTAGWQANAGLAQWSTTQDPKCRWCHMIDTKSHQYLECPAFQSIRNQHSEAVTFLQAHPDRCFFPLPVHAPDVELVRQAMHLRAHTEFHDALHAVAAGTILYTDGSCDHPKDPYIPPEQRGQL